MGTVVTLWGTKVHPDVVAELRWYFGSAESEMGVASTFGSVVKAMNHQTYDGHAKTRPPTFDEEGVPTTTSVTPSGFRNPYDVDTDCDSEAKMIARLPAAGKQRRTRDALLRTVYAGLHAIGSGHYSVLSATYEPRQWPNALLQRYGETCGVAVRTVEANDAYAQTGDDRGVRVWLDDVCRSEPNNALLDEISRRANAMIGAAHKAYSAVRG